MRSVTVDCLKETILREGPGMYILTVTSPRLSGVRLKLQAPDDGFEYLRFVHMLA